MSELADVANAAKERWYKEGYERGREDAVVNGRWLDVAEKKEYRKCSVCQKDTKIFELINAGTLLKYADRYCPNCGAKMYAQAWEYRGDKREKEYGAYTIVSYQPSAEEAEVVAKVLQSVIESNFVNPQIKTRKVVVVDCDKAKARNRISDPLDPNPPEIMTDVPDRSWSIGIKLTLQHDGEKFLLYEGGGGQRIFAAKSMLDE